MTDTDIDIDVAFAALRILTTPRPISEYHEDMGDVLWWKFPIVEAPYVGTPNDTGITAEAHVRVHLITQMDQDREPDDVVHRIHVGGWPGYHTHFSLIPKVSAPS